MELEFNQKLDTCLQCISREYQTQEQTQEVRIPEGMPDIGTVLACWGQPILRGKEWRTDSVGVTGGVMAHVLYLPEEGEEPQSLEVWLPFQMKWVIPASRQDGTLMIHPALRSADARTLSSRKLMVRTNVGVLMEALTPTEYSVYVPESVPEDVQLLKRSYHLNLPKEAGEKAFVLDEPLEFSPSEAKPATVIRTSLTPVVLEQKVMADKVIFRGQCIAHVLYKTPDGQLLSRDFDVPFSQYAELSQEYEPSADAKITPVVTNLELEQTPEGQLNLKAGLSGQYVIFQTTQADMVEDAYSPLRSVEMNQTTLNIPSLLDRRSQSVLAAADPQLDVMRGVDVAFWMQQPYMGRENASVEAELGGQFQLLYYDPEGQLQCLQTGWDDTAMIEAGEDTRVTGTLYPAGRPKLEMGMGDKALQADLVLDTQTFSGQGMTAVTGLVLGEKEEPDPQRPSLILCKAGTDTLWDIAKNTGSTVAMITEANALQGEPDPDAVLLIPLV